MIDLKFISLLIYLLLEVPPPKKTFQHDIMIDCIHAAKYFMLKITILTVVKISYSRIQPIGNPLSKKIMR